MKRYSCLIFTLIFITQYGMKKDEYSLAYLLALLQKSKNSKKTTSLNKFYDTAEDYYAKTLREFVATIEPNNKKYLTLWNNYSTTITSEQKHANPYIISAFRLRHVATALHVVYSNGDQFASMTNYLEKNISKHNQVLKKFCQSALTQENASKKISLINFIIIKPYDTQKEENAYYPYSEIPLEHFPKQLLDRIQPIKTRLFCFHQTKILDIDPQYPFFEIILYPHKAFLLTDSKKIKLYDIEGNYEENNINISHIFFIWWALKKYCEYKMNLLHDVINHINGFLYKIYLSCY